MKREMYLVAQSKKHGNTLGYDYINEEYVYFHLGKEMWAVKGDEQLISDVYDKGIESVQDNEIYQKYQKSCEELHKQEMKEMFGY